MLQHFYLKNTWLFILIGFHLSQVNAQQLVDPQATERTRALFLNLQKATNEHKILFGHQDDLAYGVGWKNIPGASDVRFSCGDYPAVYGWELGNLEYDSLANLDSVRFDQMKSWIKEGYKRGGIITLSWHMGNYHTGGSAWDTTTAVKDILPGGIHHERYKKDLDRFASFVNDLSAGKFLRKHHIPIIFRPFHEHTGNWFWWGKTHVSTQEFVQLWKFTVQYLRDTQKIHHLLYAFSTSYNYKTAEELLEFYPGDEWVDIIGIDFYVYDTLPNAWETYQQCQRILVETAYKHRKIPALTEFGFEAIPQNDWWTKVFLKNLLSDPLAGRVAYACAWRNANTKHHYVPYANHGSTPDFQEFYRHTNILFESDLWNFYKLPKTTSAPSPVNEPSKFKADSKK